MLCLLIPLTTYLIVINRRQRFEMTIMICMLLKYVAYALNHFVEERNDNEAILVIIGTLFFTLGPISHWIYAS